MFIPEGMVIQEGCVCKDVVLGEYLHMRGI